MTPPGRPAMAGFKLVSGTLFGVLGVIMFVRVLLIPAPFGQKLIGLAFPVVAVALGAYRLRQYALLRRGST
jgi:hypothetical protein